jgi:hypothetical protein
MTRLRFVAVAFVFALLCSPWTAGNAADDKSDKAPDTRMRGQLPQNWGKLGLNDEQKQKIYRIQNETRAKVDALEKQIMDLKASEKKELEKVLTTAQKARLREILSGKAPSDK